MARQVLQNRPFSRGLNTELSLLDDNTDFTRDELNSVIKPDGSRSRRRGIDYEEGHQFSRQLIAEYSQDLAFSSVEWTDIGQGVNNPYIVIQAGRLLLFYKNLGVPFSQAQSDYVLDLKPYALNQETDDYANTPVRFTVAHGALFIVSKEITPIVVKTLEETTTENPMPEDILPSCTLSCTVKTDRFGRRGGGGESYVGGDAPAGENNKSVNGGSCSFFINDVEICEPLLLYDQYDFSGDVGSSRPGDNKYGPSMFYSGKIAEYFNSLPAKSRFNLIAEPKLFKYDAYGNKFDTPSPRYLGTIKQAEYTANNPESSDDYVVFKAQDATVTGVKVSLVLRYLTMDKKDGGLFSSSKHFPVANKDIYEAKVLGGRSYTKQNYLVLQIRDFTGVEDFQPVDATPKKISYSRLYNMLNQGWTPALIGEFYKASVGGENCFPSGNLAQHYLKDSETTAFKPEALLTTTFGNTKAPNGHFILDYFNQKRAEKANLEIAMSSVARECGTTVEEILDENYSGGVPEQVPDYKPRASTVTDVCAYAGHIFFLAGEALLYSQVVSEDLSGAFKCYQDADPTSEEISDLIGTDGGMMLLPEIGEGQKLFVQGGYLVVVGDKGAVAIGGTANNIFLATAYSAFNLQPLTTQSPHSFVTTEYGTLYWGNTGIVHCRNTETGGLVLENISTETIQTLYDKIPIDARKLCKGAYNANKHEVWWLYPLDTSESKRLNGALVLDLSKGTYTKHEFVTGKYVPDVVCPLQIKNAFKSTKIYPMYAEGELNPIDTDLQPEQIVNIDLEVGERFEELSTPDKITQYVMRNFSADTSYYLKVYVNDILWDIVEVRWVSHLVSFIQPYRLTLSAGKKLVVEAVKEKPEELPTKAVGTLKVVDNEGNIISADYPIDRELVSYESIFFLAFDHTQRKVTFADLINNELLDWDSASPTTAGYPYKTYLEGYPLNLQDINRKKTMPYLITHFKRTEKVETTDGELVYKSDALASVKWSWCSNGDSGQWDMPQRVYRPDLRTYLDSDYVSTKTRVRGGGASYSVRIDSVDNSNFILDALSFDLYGDSRI